MGYLVENGVVELSLRPLARAVGSSPRVLLYYFGSKEEMVVKALARLRERQRATWSQMKAATYAKPSDACRAIWQQMSSPDSEPLFRFFYETYGLALRHPGRYADFLRSAIEDWLEYLSGPRRREGHAQLEARAFATVVIAGFRGFMLDYCASRDRERVDRAVELWLGTLDSISPNLEKHDHAE